MDSELKFLEFVALCSGLLAGEQEQLLDLIKKRYDRCNESFRNSAAMIRLLRNTSNKLLMDQNRKFVHLRDFVAELKAWTSEKKTQCGTKRKAEHRVEAVAKMARVEESTSEGSDIETKLCRAIGSGASSCAFSSSLHDHTIPVSQNSSVHSLAAVPSPETHVCALQATQTGREILKSQPEMCCTGNSVVNPASCSQKDCDSGPMDTAVCPASSVEVNHYHDAKADGPGSSSKISVDRPSNCGKSSCLCSDSTSTEHNSPGSTLQSCDHKSQNIIPVSDTSTIACHSLPDLACTSKTKEGSSIVVTNQNHSKLSGQPMKNGLAIPTAGTGCEGKISPEGKSSNGLTGLPQPGPSNEGAAGQSSVFHCTNAEQKPSSNKGNRHKRRLETLLEKLRDEIEKVREKDLSLDDMNEDDSSYIYEDRLQKKFVKAWNRLCQLQGRSTNSGRPVERKFKYEGSRYPEINRKVEKFVNRPNVFPDYHDIRGIVKKVNTRCCLRLSMKQINSISRETFLDVGESLQRRRHQDFISTFHWKRDDLFSNEGDPASFDEELRRKLEENRRIGQARLEEVVNKYTDLQMQMGEEEQQEQDDDNDDDDGGTGGNNSTQSDVDIDGVSAVSAEDQEEEITTRAETREKKEKGGEPAEEEDEECAGDDCVIELDIAEECSFPDQCMEESGSLAAETPSAASPCADVDSMPAGEINLVEESQPERAEGYRIKVEASCPDVEDAEEECVGRVDERLLGKGISEVEKADSCAGGVGGCHKDDLDTPAGGLPADVRCGDDSTECNQTLPSSSPPPPTTTAVPQHRKGRTPVKIKTSINLPKFLMRKNGDHKADNLFYPHRMQSMSVGDSITICSSDEEMDFEETKKTKALSREIDGDVIVLSDSE